MIALAAHSKLGPFQDLWDAWDEAHDEMLRKELDHFQFAIEYQFEELRAHLKTEDAQAAAYEVVDMMSIVLNLMRRLGYTPDEIADVVRARANGRMKGQTREILEKYP